MNLIDCVEKEKIVAWAKDNSSKDDSRFSFCKKDSCYNQINDNEYAREYSIKTIPELREEFDILWEKDDILRELSLTCAVAAFKRREVVRKETKMSSENIEISDFVYSM